MDIKKTGHTCETSPEACAQPYLLPDTTLALFLMGRGAAILSSAQMTAEDLVFAVRELGEAQAAYLQKLIEVCGACDALCECRAARVEETDALRRLQRCCGSCGKRAFASEISAERLQAGHFCMTPAISGKEVPNMKLMEKLNRKTLLEKVMKTRPPATSLWQKRESILLFTGTGATVLLASHMSVEDILFTIRDLADVQQVLVDQLREQCGCCDKEGEKDKPLQRVEEEALQREPQDIVEYLREQGVCLRQLARKLEQNETIFL